MYFNLFLTSILLIFFSSLAFFTPCLSSKPLVIDQDMENYIKSDNYQTDNYDAVNAAVKFGEVYGDWPLRRLASSPSSSFPSLLSNDHRSHRSLSSAPHTGSITFVYMLRSRPNDVFTEANLRSIRSFEESVKDLPSYGSYCRPVSFYTKDPANSTTCAEQASAITSWFFSPEGDLLDIPSTLTAAAQNGLLGFMDVFFSLDNLGSNLTRSSFYFEAPDEDALNEFFLNEVAPLAKRTNSASSSSSPEYQIVYYDNSGYLFGVDVNEAVLNDIQWSCLSFATVFLFVLLHTKSFFVSFFGMIGVTCSIPISLWIYKDVLGIDHMSILNFLSLFVIMGVGADDMFVFFDAYHSVSNDDDSGTLQGDVPARLGATFSRATSAMLVTSISTAASFFANVVSSLPVIREFGIFMGLVIVTNFVIIVIYFPSLVIIADRLPSICTSKKTKKNKKKPDPGGANGASSFDFGNNSNVGDDDSGDDDSGDDTDDDSNGGDDQVYNFSRESFLIDREQGWSRIDVMFHNTWFVVLYKLRLPITVLSVLAVFYAGYLSAVNIVPADKQPAFFPADHNNGLLEIIGQEYVAGRSINLEDSDAVAWGLIAATDDDDGGDGEGGSGGGGGSSSTGAPKTCPLVDGRLCSGSGTCNSLTVTCVCFIGFKGADCSSTSSTVQEDNGGVVGGDIVPSSTEWLFNQVAGEAGAPQVQTLSLVNSGGTPLNWYFVEGGASAGSFEAYMSENSDSLPPWLTLSQFSGSIAAGSVDTVTITLSPSEMERCFTETCTDEMSWTFIQTGAEATVQLMRVEMNRVGETLSPSASPTDSPSFSPTSFPTAAPTVTSSPTQAPTISTSSPSKTPTSSPTKAATCSDGEQNGEETTTDCGGSACPGCQAGGSCNADADCATGTECLAAVCSAPPPATLAPTSSPTQSPTTPAPTKNTCTNGGADGDESDVDCGGSDCSGCPIGGVCRVGGDCLTDTCDGSSFSCIGALTSAPTASPTAAPTKSPTMNPTAAPSPTPTKMPSAPPTLAPSPSPTAAPTLAPTLAPTTSPTLSPTLSPTITPTS